MKWLLLLLLACAASSHAKWLSEQQSIMGTEVRVTLWHADSATAAQAMTAAMAAMQRIDQTYSPYISSSALAQINEHAATRAVEVTPEMAMLLERSLHYSELSDGAFDITFASVGWYYDYRNKKQPAAEQKQALLPAINYQYLQFDAAKGTVRFAHPNVRIDLGGIAKGYAVDQAIAALQRFDIAHATVSAGGDSRLLGDKLGRPWLIGIKHPRAQPDNPEHVVLNMPLDNTAVSTSGDYERFFIDQQSGKRVHHIINPKTGDSAQGLMSVTVLGPTALATDALSTTVFVLGVERGLALINRLQGFDCVLIDADGQVHYSDGLAPPSAP